MEQTEDPHHQDSECAGDASCGDFRGGCNRRLIDWLSVPAITLLPFLLGGYCWLQRLVLLPVSG